DVFSSGVVPSDTAATSVPDAWVIYDQALKADGQTEAHMFWDIAKVTAHTIPTSTPDNVLMNGNTQDNNWKVPLFPGPPPRIPQLNRVTVTLWIEPMGREVLDDMVMSGYLDASIRDAMPRYQVQLVDGPDSGSPVTFEWTYEKTKGPF